MASSTVSSASPRPGSGPAPADLPAAPGGPGNTPGRDARLDNAKFILIALVVVGHAIEPLRDYAPASALYYWIYFFHMPAFIMISGYLSRSFDASSRRVEKLVVSLAVPYLIFWTIHQTIYGVERGGLPDSLSVLQPTWTLWFLIALFMWRLSVPVWQRLRWPVAIAVVISVFASTTDLGGGTLALGRVLSFLPFFVLGLSLRREHFAFLDRIWVRILSVAVLVATAVLAVPISDGLSRDWLFWKDSLTDRDIDPIMPSMGIRLAFMGLALVMTVAVLALTPKRRMWFTSLGVYTLFVYLGHSVALILLKATPWYDVVGGPVGLAVTVAVAFGLTLLLCTPWVRKATQWAVEPQMTWFLRGEAPDRGAGAGSASGQKS